MLMQMTEEQHQLAQEAKAKKRAEGLAEYKQQWQDDGLWVELAKNAHIKLPQSHIAPSGIKLDKIAKQLGMEEGWQEAFFGYGCKNSTSAIKRENKERAYGQKYSMRCYVGHLLEMWSESQ